MKRSRIIIAIQVSEFEKEEHACERTEVNSAYPKGPEVMISNK